MALEIKGTDLVLEKHLKGIRALKEEGLIETFYVISLDSEKRRTDDGIFIFPWSLFLDHLWKVHSLEDLQFSLLKVR